jgi:hypothetical protein
MNDEDSGNPDMGSTSHFVSTKLERPPRPQWASGYLLARGAEGIPDGNLRSGALDADMR